MKCPMCDGPLYANDDGAIACRACGAAASTNAGSGHTIWMRGGRVVLAEDDVADAIRAAADEYPEAFAARAETDPVVAAALEQ